MFPDDIGDLQELPATWPLSLYEKATKSQRLILYTSIACIKYQSFLTPRQRAASKRGAMHGWHGGHSVHLRSHQIGGSGTLWWWWWWSPWRGGRAWPQ